MLRIALRPRWIAALVLALAIAAVFALLSQWQLSRSITAGTTVERPTETVLPLAEVAEPQHPVRTDADGQRVSVSGSFVLADYLVLSDRLNAGEEGYWVVGHLQTEGGAGVAVGLGWAASEQTAESVAERLAIASADDSRPERLTGRFVADEAPQASGFESGELSTVSAAALVNRWQETDPAGVYNGYIVADSAADGLETIVSPRPVTVVELNWLNVFYAAEWVVFAGFAIFLWWRLVRDVWLRERREANLD